MHQAASSGHFLYLRSFTGVAVGEGDYVDRGYDNNQNTEKNTLTHSLS